MPATPAANASASDAANAAVVFFDVDGTLLDEKPVVRNDAIMMYSPYLEEGGTSE